MPSKVIYMMMETNPSLEFEFYLAQRLGKTLVELRQMSQQEFVGWQVYYGRKAQREQIAAAKGKQ